MQDALPEPPERSAVRDELERAGAAALALTSTLAGHAQLVLDFVDGRLMWFEPRAIRVPPSRLDELAGATASPGDV